MGHSLDGKYYDSSKDPTKVYEVIERPTGDGWVIAWKALYGEKYRICKKHGNFETVEEADLALASLSVKKHWEYFVDCDIGMDGYRTGWFEVATNDLIEEMQNA